MSNSKHLVQTETTLAALNNVVALIVKQLDPVQSESQTPVPCNIPQALPKSLKTPQLILQSQQPPTILQAIKTKAMCSWIHAACTSHSHRITFWMMKQEFYGCFCSCKVIMLHCSSSVFYASIAFWGNCHTNHGKSLAPPSSLSSAQRIKCK